MNDPKNQPVDIDEQRRWLIDHKATTGAAWSELSRRIDIPQGTISQFGGDTYKGDNEKLAQKVFAFRQLLAAQAQIAVEAPTLPGFFRTPTSNNIESLLGWAQRGRITVISTGPGCGKTETARNYQAAAASVWMATMAPSTAGVNNMQIEVLEALGDSDAVGTPQKLSRRIKERVRGTGGLIIVDEAQDLSEKAINEIRSWHDATGIGIALLGNEKVISRLEGGSRKAEYAQLYSRVGMRLVQNLPRAGDADAMCEAWEIGDEAIQAYVRKIAGQPGGLRSCSMSLELGTMLASGDGTALTLSHLQDAWAQLATRPVAS